MQKLFENWRKMLGEDDEGEEGVPKVECRCLCTDCVFNKNEQCVAEKIDLDFAQTDEGKWICECKTYKVSEGEEPGPDEEDEGGDWYSDEHETMADRKYADRLQEK